MSEVKKLHSQAMDMYELCLLKKHSKDYNAYEKLLKQAYQQEKKAAFLLINKFDIEPTRGILFASAANMAIEAGEWVDARKLIGQGLAGDISQELDYELKDLLQRIDFERHLSTHNVSLEPFEVQMTFEGGSAMRQGLVAYSEFKDRMDAFEQMVKRTAARKKGLAFQQTKQSKDIVIPFSPYVSVPKAASYAVSIKVFGDSQLDLFEGNTSASEVLKDVVENLHIAENKGLTELSTRIEDKAYLRHFISMARQIAPDGELLKTVGFTVYDNGEERIFPLHKVRKDYDPLVEESNSMEEEEIDSSPVAIVGELLRASADLKKITIRQKVSFLTKKGIEKFTNKDIVLTVPEGLGDIVRSHFEEEVKVKYKPIKEKKGELLDVNPTS